MFCEKYFNDLYLIPRKAAKMSVAHLWKVKKKKKVRKKSTYWFLVAALSFFSLILTKYKQANERLGQMLPLIVWVRQHHTLNIGQFFLPLLLIWAILQSWAILLTSSFHLYLSQIGVNRKEWQLLNLQM